MVNPFWPLLCAFFSFRYGVFGSKKITVPTSKRAFVVKDPFCDYLFMPNEAKCYRWSIRPITLVKN